MASDLFLDLALGKEEYFSDKSDFFSSFFKELLLAPPKPNPEPEVATNRVGLFCVALSTFTTFFLADFVSVPTDADEETFSVFVVSDPRVLVDESAYLGVELDSSSSDIIL